VNNTFSWDEFEVAVEHLAGLLAGEQFNAVVALPRGGLVLGVRMAHLLGDLPVVVPWVERDVARSDYVVSLPPAWVPRGHEPSALLLVDDFVSVGQLMVRTIEALEAHVSEVGLLRAAALFADTNAISSGPWSSLLDRLDFFRSVDNQKVWVDFAWERCDVERFGT
jgi:hypoxanthine phosphoribosyltransferase